MPAISCVSLSPAGCCFILLTLDTLAGIMSPLVVDHHYQIIALIQRHENNRISLYICCSWCIIWVTANILDRVYNNRFPVRTPRMPGALWAGARGDDVPQPCWVTIKEREMPDDVL